MKQKLKSLYVSWLIDDRFIMLRRVLHDILARLRLKRREVVVFLQLDDPYSYLLSYYLEHLIPHYERKVKFRFVVCQALGGEYMSRPDELTKYALLDCTRLAGQLGIPFLDANKEPAELYRRTLLDFVVAEHEEELIETFTRALSLFWRGDKDGVAELIGRTHGDPSETNVIVGKNQLLLRKMGHYNCATMYYGGEWYWGIDRLLYLTDRLDREKLNRFSKPVAELEKLERTMDTKLPASPPADVSGFPPLEMFHSFRSPYSYVGLQQAFDLADAFGIELKVRPVMPMVQRGVGLPRSKLRYIIQDAGREARSREVPLGTVMDPLGKGIENCMAGYRYAKSKGQERPFLVAVGEAVFSDGVDLTEDEGLQYLADRAGLDWDDFQSALEDDSWRDEVDDNGQALLDAGMWGVPSYRMGSFVCWGQDRVWLLARALTLMCEKRGSQ
jgi:2-hydroxychromene-2-carboxylate isomerase